MLSAVLLADGEIHAPERQGVGSVLIVDGRIAAVGTLDRRAIAAAAEALSLELLEIDVAGCLIIPGLIDPHEHLLGNSGERGFASRGPEIFCTELVQGAVTTVVGTLGTDNTMRTMAELLAKVKALREEGLTAFMYSGGYTLPPMTLMGSLRNDLLFVDEVIGAGEIAISDRRAVQPDTRDLAAVITDAYVGGLLSGKAGVTHLHVGEGAAGLAPLRAALDNFDLQPQTVYPTHVNRTPDLIDEAAALTHRDCHVDMDTTERHLAEDLRLFVNAGGRLDRLTVSTDAGGSSPRDLLEQLVACTRAGWSLPEVLPLVTTNTARVLGLQSKARLSPGCDADVAVLRGDSLELLHVLARGRLMVRDGQVVQRAAFLEDSNRTVHLDGQGG